MSRSEPLASSCCTTARNFTQYSAVKHTTQPCLENKLHQPVQDCIVMLYCIIIYISYKISTSTAVLIKLSLSGKVPSIDLFVHCTEIIAYSWSINLQCSGWSDRRLHARKFYTQDSWLAQLPETRSWNDCCSAVWCSTLASPSTSPFLYLRTNSNLPESPSFGILN